MQNQTGVLHAVLLEGAIAMTSIDPCIYDRYEAPVHTVGEFKLREFVVAAGDPVRGLTPASSALVSGSARKGKNCYVDAGIKSFETPSG
jgi:hypothetical protein